jgi:hypothetical protein
VLAMEQSVEGIRERCAPDILRPIRYDGIHMPRKIFQELDTGGASDQ